MKLLKKLYLYLKHRKQINKYYSLSVKEDLCSDNYNWLDRTTYWFSAE